MIFLCLYYINVRLSIMFNVGDVDDVDDIVNDDLNDDEIILKFVHN